MIHKQKTKKGTQNYIVPLRIKHFTLFIFFHYLTVLHYLTHYYYYGSSSSSDAHTFLCKPQEAPTVQDPSVKIICHNKCSFTYFQERNGRIKRFWGGRSQKF